MHLILKDNILITPMATVVLIQHKLPMLWDKCRLVLRYDYILFSPFYVECVSYGMVYPTCSAACIDISMIHTLSHTRAHTLSYTGIIIRATQANNNNNHKHSKVLAAMLLLVVQYHKDNRVKSGLLILLVCTRTNSASA